MICRSIAVDDDQVDPFDQLSLMQSVEYQSKELDDVLTQTLSVVTCLIFHLQLMVYPLHLVRSFWLVSLLDGLLVQELG
jgi:hypothetical protein